MKKIIIVCSLFVLCANLYAQKDSFDIIAFNLPEGWKKEMKASVASLDYIDKKDKSWCHIGVYKSVPSKGSIDADFESDWKEFMAGYFKITDSPQTTEVQEAEGWKVKVGVGKFKYNKKDAAAMLTTFTGFGRSVSIVTSTGSERYLETLQNFISSIELKRPDENDVVVNQQQMPSADNSGFAFHTTNFNDGWTSVIKNDWVEVTKGEIKVRLFYAIPYDYNLFTGTGVRQRDYYWDNYITRYFNVSSKQYKDDGEVIGSLQPDYIEGWATDKETGEKRFIGMRLSISPGTCYITVGSAKDEASFRLQFPKANDKYVSDLAGMDGYNKFAVTANDIQGTWQDGATNTMQWYYVTPSGYEGNAGMTVAARSATFNFGPDGNYTSIHNGATGVVGAMNTFQQNYKGKYTVTNWTVNATNRWDGKPENFDAWFVALRGGRILKLKSGGMEYSLLKAK